MDADDRGECGASAPALRVPNRSDQPFRLPSIHYVAIQASGNRHSTGGVQATRVCRTKQRGSRTKGAQPCTNGKTMVGLADSVGFVQSQVGQQAGDAGARNR